DIVRCRNLIPAELKPLTKKLQISLNSKSRNIRLTTKSLRLKTEEALRVIISKSFLISSSLLKSSVTSWQLIKQTRNNSSCGWRKWQEPAVCTWFWRCNLQEEML